MNKFVEFQLSSMLFYTYICDKIQKINIFLLFSSRELKKVADKKIKLYNSIGGNTMKINEKIKLVLISLLSILILSIFAIFLTNLDTKTLNTNINLTIPSGASTKSIAKILKQNNMIKSGSFCEPLLCCFS